MCLRGNSVCREKSTRCFEIGESKKSKKVLKLFRKNEKRVREKFFLRSAGKRGYLLRVAVGAIIGEAHELHNGKNSESIATHQTPDAPIFALAGVLGRGYAGRGSTS